MRKRRVRLVWKKFGPGKLQVEKVWAQNIFIDFLAELDNFKKIYWGPLSSTFLVGRLETLT